MLTDDDLDDLVELQPATADLQEHRRERRQMRQLASAIAVVLTVGIFLAFVGQASSGGDGIDRATGEGAPVTEAQFAALRQAAPPTGQVPHKQHFESRVGDVTSSIDFVVDEAGRSSGEMRLGNGRPFAIATEGNVVYLPTLDRQAWLGFRLTDLDAITAAAGDDPLAFLRRLTDPGQVRMTGTETVRDDVVTTRFHAEVPFSALMDLAIEQGTVPADAAAQLEGMDLQLDPVQMDVWLDDAGFLRQFTTSISFGRTTIENTIEVFDLGIPVTVALPDPADVVSIVESGTTDPQGPYVAHLQMLLLLP